MRFLSLILALFVMNQQEVKKSPHGKDFKLDCKICHTASGWNVDPKTTSFNHASTGFLLEGQHMNTDCRQCHQNLMFTQTANQCAQCHTDVHSNTLDEDCAQCHTPKSWVISNISDIHQMSRFPLIGAHSQADCYECHSKENFLKFEPLNTECIDCHRSDYTATTQPNHVSSGYSENCVECHSMSTISWSGAGFNHDFFPLTKGHAITDCFQCHADNNYSNLSTECVSCHLQNYNSTTNPNHTAAGIPQNCDECHTTNPGWKPASFEQHNQYYVIEGAHTKIATDCFACHQGSYQNTPNTCYGCHAEDYNKTDDPNHSSLNFSTNCTECHSQNAWEPSTFDHSQYYVLQGAHANIKNDCNKCHQNGYENTPTTCYACHTNDYNNANDPNHVAANFPTECTECHSQNAWEPATFDHDGKYFPIYSGKHKNEWNSCTDCHTNSNNYAVFSCITCHEHSQSNTDGHHREVSGYVYNATSCFDCHPTGRAEDD